MIAVRFVALAALAVWVGATVALGTVLVPGPAALDAELHRFHVLAWGCGAVLLLSLVVMKLMGPPPRGFVARVAVVTTMLAIAVYTGVRPGPFDARAAVLIAANAVAGLALLSWYVRE